MTVLSKKYLKRLVKEGKAQEKEVIKIRGWKVMTVERLDFDKRVDHYFIGPDYTL